jgi:TRAP-type C4-dicarboxylate transport system permease small subunit
MTSETAPAATENPVARALEGPVRAMQILMGWVLLALCFATAYEILARRLFGVSLQGVNEIGAYLLAIGSTWGFSMALLQRAHSRVDFLFPRFPRALRSVLNLLAALSLAALAVFSAWEGWSVLKDTLRWQARASTPLQTPLWIPQSLWLFGLVVFAGVASAFAIHAALLFVRDRRRLDRFYGPPSLEEQIEIETQGTLPTDAQAALP